MRRYSTAEEYESLYTLQKCVYTCKPYTAYCLDKHLLFPNTLTRGITVQQWHAGAFKWLI